MVTITPRAAEMLNEVLQQQEMGDYGLRLVAQDSGCCSGPAYGLMPESRSQPEDTVVTQDEVRMFIDPDSLSLVEGATIDYIEHPDYGEGFTIQNPNEAASANGGTCGCQGESAEGECNCDCDGDCACQS